jgi:hypothetical protein
MIKEIRNLKKVDDILNSEGTILGLCKDKDKFYLRSYLKDKTGMVYYSVEEQMLKRYFKNELTLCDVFLASEDLVIPRNFRNETVYLLIEELTGLIACGEELFLENSGGMRNDELADQFKN